MKKETSTNSLLNELANADMNEDFESYLAKHNHDTKYHTFSAYLNSYLSFHPNLHVKDILRSCGLDANYARQVINGDKNGSKYKIVAICIAAHMTYTETQRALFYSGNARLYAKDDYDAAIIICINNACYDIAKVNDYLYEKGLEILQ